MSCVPHRVYSNYFDSTDDEVIGLNHLLFKTKEFLVKKFDLQYRNKLWGGSGQTVDHLHIHIIPRYPNDVDDPRGGVRGVIPSKQKY